MSNVFQTAMQKTMAGRIKQKELAENIDISIPYINDLIRGRKTGQESVRRRIAEALGYNDYEAFLDIGRKELGQKTLRPTNGQEGTAINSPDFLVVPYSDHMILNDEPVKTIEITKDRNSSPVAIFRPTLGRCNPVNLQAFLLKKDNMEPIISRGSIVVADLTENDPGKIKEGEIYILRGLPGPGECSVNHLNWVEKNNYLAIESPNLSYQTMYRHLNEIHLVGQVIWSLQTHRELRKQPF